MENSATGDQQSTADSPASPERPSDDQIIEQENAIRATEAQRLPYVGDLEELSALKAEYEAGSQVFVQKIESLAKQYSGVRRARGDGNCFFRSFIFGYLENLIATNNLTERDRILSCIKVMKANMLEHGFQELVIDDPLEILLELLTSIGVSDDPLTSEILVLKMREQGISDYIVLLLRLVVSCQIQRQREFFAPFIMGMSDDCLSVETFCEKHVEPMGVESDHIHIVAVQGVFQVPVRVAYLDNSMTALLGGGNNSGDSMVTCHDFIPDDIPASAPTVHLLYRPGHYDILYPREAA
mmetsp:Transcript_25309/g.70775  ORF Transcript_25309/g.70775 Transcript_25309/m.70775 type:complete len:297 (-) Transcript_25309:377-1267(-)